MVPFLYAVWEGLYGWALAIFLTAALTDSVDGYVARRFKQESRLGRVLDPAADKLLTTVSFVVMAFPHAGLPSIPVSLALAVVSRDILITAGALAVYLVTGFKEFTPTLLGKINTFLELGLIVVFLTFHTAGVFTSLLPPLYVVVFASVVLSGVGYSVKGVRIFLSHRKGQAKLEASNP